MRSINGGVVMFRKAMAVFAALPMIFLSGIRCAALTENDISAKAAVVYQPDTGQVLFSKNMNEKLPMASTTKIMTTLLLLENGSLDVPFTVDSDAIKTEGSSMGLVEGDTVTGYALCAGMLLPSGNDAANASAVYVSGSVEKFAQLMNFRAGLIGMKNSHFVTPSGLHDDDHYSTAYDMALLTAEALKNPVFAELCGSTTAKVSFGDPPYDRYLKNSNKLLSMYEGCIGVKTGFTDEAGRCLVSACEKNGVTLICVTLNDADDWNDHMAMYDDSYSRITPVEIDIGSVCAGLAGGYSESTELVQSDKVIYPSADGYNPEIKIEIISPSFLYAPFKKGDVKGKAEFYADGVKFAECDLEAAEDEEYFIIESSGVTSLRDRIKAVFEKILK